MRRACLLFPALTSRIGEHPENGLHKLFMEIQRESRSNPESKRNMQTQSAAEFCCFPFVRAIFFGGGDSHSWRSFSSRNGDLHLICNMVGLLEWQSSESHFRPRHHAHMGARRLTRAHWIEPLTWGPLRVPTGATVQSVARWRAQRTPEESSTPSW